MEETAATENKDETPSLTDVWRILKVNTEKLVQEVETLKGNYEDLKKSLTFTQRQIEEIIKKTKQKNTSVHSLN